MTTHEISRSLPFGAITLHRAVRFVEDLGERIAEWRRTRHTVAELRRLSRAQLEDIGLTPGDVDALERTGHLF